MSKSKPNPAPVAFWLAVSPTEGVAFGLSADDGNGGDVARQLVNDYINNALNDGEERLNLVAVYHSAPDALLHAAGVIRSVAHNPGTLATHGRPYVQAMLRAANLITRRIK